MKIHTAMPNLAVYSSIVLSKNHRFLGAKATENYTVFLLLLIFYTFKTNIITLWCIICAIIEKTFQATLHHETHHIG